MGFWDALDSAPSTPSALPRGGAGATSSFWDAPQTEQSGQTAPVQTPQEPAENVEDSPGNPLSYLAGMAKNVVMDIPDVLKGLWTIGKATGADALAGIQQVIPGEQELEGIVEEQGYNWGNIARAAVGWGDMPSVLLDDYKSRYGFNGLEEVKDQLYSNPLSYILDALAVAGGVSVAAKTGAKLGVVSQKTAGAIRGIAPEVEAAMRTAGSGRPVAETMSLRATLPGNAPVESFASTIAPRTATGTTMPGLFGISTSFNPMKRMIQNTVINKILTRSTDDVGRMIENNQWERLGISPENSLLTGTGDLPGVAAERLGAASQAGMRVIRPLPEKFIASRAARYISGVSKQEFYGERNAMIQSLQHILQQDMEVKKQDWKLVKDIMGTDDYLLKRLRGEVVTPKGLPDSTPIDFEDGTLPVFNELVGDVPKVSIDPTVHREMAEMVQNYFGSGAGGRSLNPFSPGQTPDVAPQAFNAPHVGTATGRTARGTGLIGNMKDAPNVARDFAARNNLTLLGVRNYLADPNVNWNGMHYFFQRADGQIVELNIADQQLYDAQRLVSAIRQHVANYTGVELSWNTEAAALKELRANVADIEMGIAPDDAKAIARLEQIERLQTNLRDEFDAANVWAERVWHHPMRRYHGDIDGNYGEDPNVMKVDQLFNWSTEWNMLNNAKLWNKDWAKGITRADGTIKIIQGPFTVALNRAFMPMKLEALHHITEWGREKIAQTIKDNIVIARNSGNPLNTEEVVDNIAELFSDVYHLPKKAVRDALYVPTDADVARALYGRAKQGDVLEVPLEPTAETRVLELAEDIRNRATDRVAAGFKDRATEYRARPLPLKDPDEAANLVIRRLLDNVRGDILKGTVDGQLLDDWGWRTFVDAVDQIPGYYPHIRLGGQTGMWWKGSTMKAPQMAFNKGFKGYLMESGRVEADLFRAYSFRAYQQLRHLELADQFESLRPMARELTRHELMQIQSGAMTLEGEVLFSPDYAQKALGLHSAMLDDIHDAMKDGMLYEDAARDALNGLNEELQNITTEALAGAKVYALPKYVADQFKSGFLQGFSPANMRMFWDKPRDMWISTTLGMNPRWFIYRMMGNIMFGGIGGGPRDLVRQFGWARAKNNEMIQMLLGDSKVLDELGNETGQNVLQLASRGYASGEMQKLGFVGSGAKPGRLGVTASPVRMRLWGSAKDEWPRLTAMADWVYNRRIWNLPKGIIGRTTRRVNLMEQAERRGVALSAYGKAIGSKWDSNLNLARKIADEGINENLAARMQTEANWILGNYTMLSPLERDVVRRFLMPFYPFYRHMLKFATRMPWDHPVKSQVLRLLHEVDEDMGPHLPDYLGGGIYIGEIGGTPNYWNTTHWNPLAELALPESSPIPFLDPRLRTLYSAWSGTDPFNRPYHADNVYTAPNGVEMIKTSTGWQPFEGIQHEPWLTMLMSYYSGPGSALVNAQTRGWSLSPQKFVAGNLGITLSPRDVQGDALRQWEAEWAAMSSSSAAETPISWGR